MGAHFIWWSPEPAVSIKESIPSHISAVKNSRVYVIPCFYDFGRRLSALFGWVLRPHPERRANWRPIRATGISDASRQSFSLVSDADRVFSTFTRAGMAAAERRRQKDARVSPVLDQLGCREAWTHGNTARHFADFIHSWLTSAFHRTKRQLFGSSFQSKHLVLLTLEPLSGFYKQLCPLGGLQGNQNWTSNLFANKQAFVLFNSLSLAAWSGTI